jgi:hypothetical protein
MLPDASIAVEVAESVRRSLMEDELGMATAPPLRRLQRPAIPEGRERSRSEVAWYSEIAEAVARTLADEMQYLQGTLPEDQSDPAVDPHALAGLDQTVLNINDANLLNMPTSPSQLQQRACNRGAGVYRAGVNNFRLTEHSVSESDIIGIARAVLMSLDEEVPRARS